MKVPLVFVDTNVLKFSATELTRFQARPTRVNWGGKGIELLVHDVVQTNPNLGILNKTLRVEADLLPSLAELGRQGAVEYIMQLEAKLESWGLRNMDSDRGDYYGTPIRFVEGPFKYSRTVGGAGIEVVDRQFEFLKSIDHPRFAELQRMTGAYQGANEMNRNQLLDAFHLWCAEHAGAEFFLTLDFKLIKVVARSPSKSVVRLVRPSELVASVRPMAREPAAGGEA